MNKSSICILAQLIKIPVALPVTFLCFTGYFFFGKSTDIHCWISCIGVFLLSCSSSILNQIIEHKYDAMMDRTKLRPIPSGAISLKASWTIASVLFLTGVVLLLYLSLLSASLGILAVLWYILVYTLLKRITPFATIPGALTGILPLLIGYVAAGGTVFDLQIMVIAVFIFIWQIPHFWLLMLVYGRDYEKARFPTLFRIFSERNLKLWISAWIVTLVISSFLLIPYKIITSISGMYALFILGFFVICNSAYFLQIQSSNRKHKILFHVLNGYMLTILLGILADMG